MPTGNSPSEVKRIKGIPFFGLADKYTTGNIYFVDSGSGVDDIGSYGDHPDKPFATIDYAIGYCTASNGDVIYVMPGHAETISAAAGIDVDIAGVSIIGLGNGDNKPTITIGTATTADFDINADDVLVKGLNFASAINSLANFITVGANDFTIEDCKFTTASTLEAYAFINLETTFDGLTVRNCTFLQPTDPEGTDAGAGTGLLYCVDSENILLEGCYARGQFETSIVHNKTTKCQGLWIKNCFFIQELSGAETVTLVAASTGGMTGTLSVVTNSADVAEANVVGTESALFFYGADSGFGNDGGGGQQAKQMTAAS